MSNDFTWEKIADWIEGRLTEREAAALAAALPTASTATQAEVEWLRAFYKLSEGVPLRDLSDATRQRLRTQFEQLNAPQPLAPEPFAALVRGFRVLLATLASDSWITPLVGVRRSVRQGLRHGDAHRDSRQLIYKTELAEVALNIRPRLQEGVLDLRCQLFAGAELNLQTVSAQLVQNGRFRQTHISDLGDFVFGSVLPGDYELTLTSDDFEIAIPNLSFSL